MNSTRPLNRSSTAMHLLQSGVAFSVIALWLGHESRTTTHRYVEANLEMKQKALARLEEPDTKMSRYHPGDDLMKFLQALQLCGHPADSSPPLLWVGARCRTSTLHNLILCMCAKTRRPANRKVGTIGAWGGSVECATFHSRRTVIAPIGW
jgi:hypothetical protein